MVRRGRNGVAMVRVCNGVTIFPKLPVYLREYHGIYLKTEE
jgi:hypothetical protein